MRLQELKNRIAPKKLKGATNEQLQELHEDTKYRILNLNRLGCDLDNMRPMGTNGVSPTRELIDAVDAVRQQIWIELNINIKALEAITEEGRTRKI